ncbi:MAG: RNA-binding protein [Bryobacteraceae bacterium]|nr:RNA-binding protein [Bryobacteraceae bacterium]
MTNIFVGNLSYQTTESELEGAFAEFGAVERVSVVRDRDTGQPRGFAFVEMTNANEAANAINAMNGREMNGRALNVNEARPREERRGGGGGGFGGGRSGGGYGGGSGGGGGRRREPRW